MIGTLAAAKGNQYAKGNLGAAAHQVWRDAIRRAAMQRDGKQLRALADRLIDKALEGDVSALKEIGDRLDGRPAQTIEMSGDMTMRHCFALPLAESELTADEWARQSGR